jgi:hypothetical protein
LRPYPQGSVSFWKADTDPDPPWIRNKVKSRIQLRIHIELKFSGCGGSKWSRGGPVNQWFADLHD